MAQSKFIQSVLDAAGGRPKSTQWYKDKIKEFGKPGALDLIRDGKRDNKPFVGKLNMFFYDPKFKKTLPYYDTFPLVLPLERYSDGFLGINFHYLPIPLRVKLLNTLVEAFTDDSNEKLDMTWRSIANLRSVRPIVRRYKARNVKSMFLKLSVEDMLIAVLLPVQQFYSGEYRSRKSVSPNEVYRDTRQRI